MDNFSPVEIVAKNRRVLPRWLPPSKAIEFTTKPTEEVLQHRKAKMLPRYEEALALDRTAQDEESALRLVGLSRHFGFSRPSPEVLERAGDPGLTARAEKVSAQRVSVDRVPTRSELICSHRTLREHVKRFPRDAVGWCELTRCRAMLGQLNADTIRYMQIAVAIAPSNIYVLRAASRFFSHQGDHERALEIIRSVKYWDRNPWLLAAEVATSTAASVTPRGVVRGKALLSARGIESATKTSELAAAIATEEWKSGAIKKAAQLVNPSIPFATENALAQAYRLSLDIPAISIPEAVLNQPGSYEMGLTRAVYREDWDKAIKLSEEWRALEPFSSRPVVLGSCLALDEPTAVNAERLASIGLENEPRNNTLLNNRAFSRLLSGNTVEACDDLALALRSRDARRSPFLLATLGLLAYRMSEFELGRRCYYSAVKEFENAESIQSMAMAQLLWVRAERSAGLMSGDVAARLISEFDGVHITAYPTYAAMKTLLLDDQVGLWHPSRDAAANLPLNELSAKFELPLIDLPEKMFEQA